jgi:outer membrane protein assembly factor BamB
VLRDAQDLTVLRLSDGTVAWRKSSPTPIAAIEPLGDLIVVCSDRMTAYAGATGVQAWQVPVRGGRIAVLANGRRIVAVTQREVSAIDATGTQRWHAALPGSVAGSRPDQVTAGDRAAYAVFRPRPDRSESTDIDVVAFALDTAP